MRGALRAPIFRLGNRLDGDGMLVVPDAPGLGIELDENAVGRYALDG